MIGYLCSPNAEEALSLLSLPLPPSKSVIEDAADKFLRFGVGSEGSGWVIVRSGELGAYIKSRTTSGRWIEAFWTPKDADKVVDVTGMFALVCSDWSFIIIMNRCRKQLSGGFGSWAGVV